MTSLKIKVLPRFPSSVTASSPITLSTIGGSYSFALDYTALRATLDPIYLVTTLSSIILSGSTSGTATVQASAIAGSSVLTLPVATDTLVGKATTDTLTNKTFDTAGTGNALKIAGTTISAKTGTGSVVLATSPALTTPAIDVATGTSLAVTGALSSSGTAGVGYATGAGGTVTQLTSRTTGVTLNKICGSIVLFTAAGSASVNQFTVTNSAVGTNDVVVVSVRSASNTYNAYVASVGAGSFAIAFSATSGTASDAPTINFAVIKAVVT